MAHSLIYTGLSLNTSNLGANDYAAFAVAGAVEIPAYAIAMFTVEYFGRRPSLIALVMLGGVSCLCTALVRKLMQLILYKTFNIIKQTESMFEILP